MLMLMPMQLKLTDFGLSERVTSTGLRPCCGTPQYFAPELLDCGENGYGKEVDMWSAGVIMYIMLSGCFPFQDTALFDHVIYCSAAHCHHDDDVAVLYVCVCVCVVLCRVDQSRCVQLQRTAVEHDLFGSEGYDISAAATESRSSTHRSSGSGSCMARAHHHRHHHHQ